MVCYVILHYQNIEITTKCVQTLLDITTESRLIIVDNCSPNGSGKVLERNYKSNDRVSVILNDKNVGFAKGNNLGYRYAKKHFMPELMIVMNNDVIINDEKFEDIITDYINENKIDVLGPDIITVNGNHQNPLAYKPLSSKYIRRRIKFDKIKILLFKNNLILGLYMAYKKEHPIQLRLEPPKEITGCILHGSCVIYNKRYIEAEEYAFLPVTYMYNEEAILYDYLEYKGYRTGYCSAVSVLHMEGASTSKNDKEKILFRFRNNTKSLSQQLNERNKYIRE